MLRFTKMHGAGNDFVVLDAREGLKSVDLAKLTVAICDRHFGVGADGLIAIDWSKAGNVQMRYFNASDGSSSVCGNGLRCVARYVYSKGWVSSKQTKFVVDTGLNLAEVEVSQGGAKVTVDMGQPFFEGAEIPVAEAGEHLERRFVVSGRELVGCCVGMGNPHLVIFVEDVKGFDVCRVGAELEVHPFFPKKTNVEFVQIVDRDSLCIRIWERGVGETLACGTGASAVAAAAIRTKGFGQRLRIIVPGGEFVVAWDKQSNKISLTGPAEEVFSGEVDLDLFR